MALNPQSLKGKIVTEMKSKGFVVDGEFARSAALAEAIANAVIEEITTNALVNVTSGSTAGSYKVT